MDTNVIYAGDNTSVLRTCIDDNSIDLIYADPPFFSNRQYEIIWNDGYELKSYEDRWKGGIENYVAWMEPRLRECYRVLKKTGTFYLHCDWRANAHLRILLDKIFGEKNLRNELIWCFRGAGYPKTDFGRRHHTIFRYSKTDSYTFNLDDVREEYAKTTKERFKHYVGNVRAGKDFGAQKLHPKGKHPDDWWQVQPIAPSANARLGYATQKPEKLLEIIIKASAKPNQIVLDPFCGGGTTIAVANNLRCKWIGIDVSPKACKVTAKRLHRLSGKDIQITGLPRTIPELKKITPFEFQKWVFEKLHGYVSSKMVCDYGIDGLIDIDIPCQVKQSEKVGRNVVDNFETAIRRMGKRRGVIVAFSFGSGAYEEVARCNNKEQLHVKLKTVKEILDETY